MMPEQPKPDKKKLLRQALRDLPGVVIGYGLGYGVGRTAIETLLEKPENYSRAVRYGLPALAATGAGYAGMRAARMLTTEDKR